jgi:hypothetical protein
VFGYYGVFMGLQYQNERSITRALDSDVFEEFETITLKVPMSVPYMPDQLAFERVTGKFEHQGELYRLVKQKYAKDTLIVLCIKDVEHKKIDRALSDYAKTVTDIATTDKSQKASIGFLKEYLPLLISIDSSTGWTMTVGYHPIGQTLLSTYSVSISHPPEMV